MNKLKIALNTGSFAGLAGFSAFLVLYFIGVNPIGNASYFFAWIPIPFVYRGVIKVREEELEGFISFWEAFKAGAMMAFVYSSLYAMLVFIFATFVDGQFVEDFIEQAILAMEQTKDITINLLGESLYEQNMEQLLKMTPATQAKADFFNKYIFTIIVAFIIGFVVKKNKPIFDTVK